MADEPPQKRPRKKLGPRCKGGQPGCNKFIKGYEDVEGVGCCEECDRYIDENPYDPYWEHMANDFEFESTNEYKKLQEKNLLEDNDAYDKAYEKAYEKYQENYEKWPDMRRRMAREDKKRQSKKL
jgi:hypothetical protein